MREINLILFVSTRSRPKAAEGLGYCGVTNHECVSTRSRPKAAEGTASDVANTGTVSTHSRPKAADPDD